MRKILTIAAVLALAGCGGGGGGSSTTPTGPSPSTAPSTTPSSKYVTPTFTIKIPARGSKMKNAIVKNPKYISSNVLSVVITLTADSVGIAPGSINGNPATTSVPANSCNSGCTVNGPPSPPGTDSFTVVTYNNAVPASGAALNAGQANVQTINAGQSNGVTITLGAIPATLQVNNVFTPTAGHQGTPQTTTVSIQAADASGVTIPTSQSPAVFYADATGAPLSVKLTDPDTNQHGSCLVPSGSSTCTSGSPTFVLFSGPDTTNVLSYDGLAENAVTLSATASTATTATATFQPNLVTPAFMNALGTPSGVALAGPAEIDLFVDSTLGGIGSTGSETFSEAGWTESPYNNALTFNTTGACTAGAGLATAISQFATVSAGTNSTTNGTPFTATSIASSPTPGSCPVTITDGLTGNSTDSSNTLTVTYSTSSISASAKHRHN
jgi:hypothetical protein